MKIFKVLAVFMVAGLFLVGCEDELRTSDIQGPQMELKGGDLVGAHYNLNIIGVKNVKDADMDNSNGHVIFVGLGEAKEGEVTTKILLFDSADSEDSDADYRVLDKNGTDGEASFELPKPGYDPYLIGSEDEVWSDYSIWVRPLGKPGGWATITTCAELNDETALFDLLDKKEQKTVMNGMYDGAYCSIEQVSSDVTFRKKGKTTWADVTAELTSIVFEIAIWEDLNDNDEMDPEEVIDLMYVRVPIFDPMLDGEFWKYDNFGLKLLQVRFYPFGVDVTEKDLDEWK